MTVSPLVTSSTIMRKKEAATQQGFPSKEHYTWALCSTLPVPELGSLPLT
jgi:hypothetical protein